MPPLSQLFLKGLSHLNNVMHFLCNNSCVMSALQYLKLMIHVSIKQAVKVCLSNLIYVSCLTPNLLRVKLCLDNALC